MSRAKSLRLKARKDFRGFCARCVKIKTKNRGIVPMVLNKPQLYVLEKMLRMEQDGLPVRIVLLKGRQIGASTFCQAWLAHKAFTIPGSNCLTIGQNLDMASELFGKVEMMRDNFPDWLGVSKKNTRKRTGRRLSIDEPLHSLLYVETAENKDAGRSLTFQHLQATEVPFWPDPERTLGGALQSVPNEVGTSVIIESTAQGAGDYFHEMYKRAKLGPEHEEWNGYTPIFIPWYWLEEYQREWRDNDRPLSLVEKKLKKQYGLTDQQTLFYRDKKAELGDLVLQEYPFTDEEAFQYSGRPFFRPADLDNCGADSVKPPEIKGDFVYEGGRPVLRDTGNGDLWVWEKPKPGKVYTVSADPSGGGGGDFSALHILAGGTEQVASYRGQVTPDDFAVLIYRMCLLYNQALAVPERNGVGLATILKLTNDLGYTNVYQHKRTDREKELKSLDYGFKTSHSSRPVILSRLYEMVKDDAITIRCERTLGEMRTFVYPDAKSEKPAAQPGTHDDLVMALAIGLAPYEPGATGKIESITVKRPIRVSRKTGY